MFAPAQLLVLFREMRTTTNSTQITYLHAIDAHQRYLQLNSVLMLLQLRGCGVQSSTARGNPQPSRSPQDANAEVAAARCVDERRIETKKYGCRLCGSQCPWDGFDSSPTSVVYRPLEYHERLNKRITTKMLECKIRFYQITGI